MIDPPSANAARSPPSVSTVVSGRMPSSVVTTTGSPLRCGISTGDDLGVEDAGIGCAAAARWCERAATASCASRVDLEPLVVPLGRRAHALAVVRVGESVERHVVEHLDRCRTPSRRASP